MKRLAAILFLFLALLMPARAQLVITNNTILPTYSDSFGIGIYGQRQNFFLMSFYVQMYPQFVMSPRDRSRSGDDNTGMKTNREPMLGMQDWGPTQAKTNVIAFWYVSGNHKTGNPSVDSNSVWSDLAEIIQGPTTAYNRFGQFTNDWTQANPELHFRQVIIGDIAYHGAVPTTLSRDYSYGGRTVALANGIPFVDSYVNMSNAEATAYGIDPNAYWFNAPALDHPANELQFVWHLTTIKALGEDTNIFTALLDWNASTPLQTNHCTATGISLSGSTFTFTFHADRMGSSYYTPDASQTNDCTGAFVIMPALTNYQCEILRVSNAPAGRFTLTEDGVVVGVFAQAQLRAGINLFTDVHTGAMWWQKKQTLALLCDYANVSRTNASDTYQPNGNQLWFKQFSYAATVWPTNNISVDSYIAQSDMVARNTELFAEDQVLHANAQQTNHTFSFSPEHTMNVTTFSAGTVWIQ